MLVRILTEPRNAYVPQYQALFQMDKVNLINISNNISLIMKQYLGSIGFYRWCTSLNS
jgi:ATP-dependent protease Clp ATPase subunit